MRNITLSGSNGRITFKGTYRVRMWIIFARLRIGTTFGLL
jgi:hypothetical protein